MNLIDYVLGLEIIYIDPNSTSKLYLQILLYIQSSKLYLRTHTYISQIRIQIRSIRSCVNDRCTPPTISFKNNLQITLPKLKKKKIPPHTRVEPSLGVCLPARLHYENATSQRAYSERAGTGHRARPQPWPRALCSPAPFPFASRIWAAQVVYVHKYTPSPKSANQPKGLRRRAVLEIRALCCVWPRWINRLPGLGCCAGIRCVIWIEIGCAKFCGSVCGLSEVIELNSLVLSELDN